MSILIVLLVGLVGVLAGGLVNALADDLPERTTLRPPHYADDTPRPPIAWLGILALVTGHRASPEGARLTWRYPVVEIVLGVVYALLAAAHPLDGAQLFQLVFLAILMLVMVIDIEHRLILFVVILPACVLALLAAALVPVPPPDLGDALLGGLVGFGVYFAIFLGGVGFSALMASMRGEEIPEVAFGFGDVLLATLSGMLLGWQAFLFALMITIFLGAAGAVLYLFSRMVIRRPYAMFTALPYGPYIVLGTVIMMLWRDEVRAFLLGS
jgi:leader peptidase (prepilin peptidase)/N-methyltransferase